MRACVRSSAGSLRCVMYTAVGRRSAGDSRGLLQHTKHPNPLTPAVQVDHVQDRRQRPQHRPRPDRAEGQPLRRFCRRAAAAGVPLRGWVPLWALTGLGNVFVLRVVDWCLARLTQSADLSHHPHPLSYSLRQSMTTSTPAPSAAASRRSCLSTGEARPGRLELQR